MVEAEPLERSVDGRDGVVVGVMAAVFPQLSASCRRILSAYYVEGQSLREAAKPMSLAYSSVAKTLKPVPAKAPRVPGVTRHLDELTLLLYTVKDLDPEVVAATAAHLSNCEDCAAAFTRVREIDLGLRGLATARALTPVPSP